MVTDKEQAAQGKTIQVGLNQIYKPTPMFMKHIFRAIAFLSGVWAIIPPDMMPVNEETLADINRWLLVGNTVILFAIKFFGWDYKQD